VPKLRANKVVLAPRKKHTSKYAAHFAGMASLKPGDVWLISCAEFDVDAYVLRNRLNAAQSRSGVKPPAGCVFRKRVTKELDLAVYCEKL
jgi:hypothetical protein